MCLSGAVMSRDEPLSLPHRPQPPPRPPFPLLASLAPLLAALLIWWVTGSGFALIFAVLSPVVALAGMVDARRSRRRRAQHDLRDYEQALQQFRTSVEERHEELRQARKAQTPSVQDILADPTAAARWRCTDATVVSLGLGTVQSDLRISGTDPAGEHRELRLWAAGLHTAPLIADLAGGLGIVGSRPLARALARGIVVQLCFALPPSECALGAVPANGWAWTAGLPHTQADRRFTIRIGESGPEPNAVFVPVSQAGTAVSLMLHVADRLEDLPPGCATVVRLAGADCAIIMTSPCHAGGLEFRPELVSSEHATRFAVEARRQANRAGLLEAVDPLPQTLALAELNAILSENPPLADRDAAGATTSLRCLLGRSEGGDLCIDLVRAGPHAVVGGTTGSGKSELLVTWVTSLAGTYSPAQVTFLLVDFKGGTAFRPLGELPHCVGLITDLDTRGAARALASLGAELQYRERVLADARAADISDVRVAQSSTPLPRLVIVVDEFASMINVFPELHALFVDVAARGRSLGVHLILCTQRPSGVVRDALLANCSLRLSLRVNNPADSVAVIGTDAAAALDPEIPGRCLVAASAGVMRCQVATAAESDVGAASRRWTTGPVASPPRRPWLDPLPAVITHRDVCGSADAAFADCGGEAGAAWLLGLVDEPERQRYRVARWNPAVDGHLLVVGAAGSGKTNLLARLAAQATGALRAQCVPADVEGTWDALSGASRAVEGGAGVAAEARVLLLDDFDSVCARWDPDHRLVALDMLDMLLRDGPAVGVFVAVAVQRLVGAVHHLSSMCPNLLLLGLPSVQDHVSAGGTAAQFDATLPPGGGHWQGLRIQLCAEDGEPAGRALRSTAPVTPVLNLDRPVLVVSGSPGGAAARWARAARGGSRVLDISGMPALVGADRLEVTEATGSLIVVGDADAWQAQWTLLAALRTRAVIVFEGAAFADYRSIARRRDLPPPLAAGRGHVWVLQPDGVVARASLPVWPIAADPATADPAAADPAAADPGSTCAGTGQGLSTASGGTASTSATGR